MSVSTATEPRTVVRAESVGSLLRPPRLRAMFPEVYAGHKTLSPTVLDAAGRERLAELESLADEAVTDAVRKQIDIGLDVITDGEMRRAMFTHSVVDALGGFDDSDKEFAFTNDQGETMAPPSGPLVGRDRVRKVANPAAREVEFVRSITDYPAKVTFPAPSYWYCEPADLTGGAYSSQEEFVADVVEIQKELVAEVIAAGARHIQLDWPPYVMAVDPHWVDDLPGGGSDSLEDLMARFIATDNAVLDSIPAGITKAMHICRGNYRSMWMTEGSLEPIAEQIFDQVSVDRLLIEWEDTDREGDYSPLRFLPKDGPIIVMGVVSSKNPQVETPDEIERRIVEAARYVDLAQLAVSPQCGFASTWEGNELAEDSQWRKLACVAEVAQRLWPK